MTTSTTEKHAGLCSANFVRRTLLLATRLGNVVRGPNARISFPQLRTMRAPRIHSDGAAIRGFSTWFVPSAEPVLGRGWTYMTIDFATYSAFI